MRGFLAVYQVSGHHRAQDRVRRAHVTPPRRLAVAPETSRRRRQVSRRRSPRPSGVVESGVARTEPELRVAGDSHRPVVERGDRGPGDRSVPPHRSNSGGEGDPAAHQRHG